MSKHAIMPESLRRRTLGDLRVGDQAWAVPWAMEVDDQRRCWLSLGATAHERPGGTVQMRVQRQAEGFVVELAEDGDHEYDPQGPDRRTDQYAPVANLYRRTE